MTSSTPPETTSKSTPEQCQLLGRVYAMILRWNREDDLLHEKQAGQSASSSIVPQDSAVFAEIIGQE
jgi:hypothetical protein